MPEEPQDEQTQETAEGHKIPIPKRKDFFRDLAKIAKPRKKGEREEPPESSE